MEASPIKKPPPNDLGEKHYLHPRMLVNDNLSSSPRSLGSRNNSASSSSARLVTVSISGKDKIKGKDHFLELSLGVAIVSSRNKKSRL